MGHQECNKQKGQQGTASSAQAGYNDLALIPQLSGPYFLTSTTVVQGLISVINPLFPNTHSGSTSQTEI